MRLGIDFGTTRTVVAVSDRGNYPLVSFLDRAGDAYDWFPSVVADLDGTLAFGFDALERAGERGWTLLRSFKRELGAPGATPDRTLRIGESEHRIGDVMTGFLSALRRALVERSNVADAADAELEVVVAAPAHALGPQRFLTVDAFRRAGFRLLGFLDEPSAAGFEYTHRFRKTLGEGREHVIVYDLGGGTFDAALVRLQDLHHEVVTTGGDPHLGGDDFDEVLTQMAEDELGPLTPELRLAVRERARAAKEALHVNSRRVVVDLGELGLPVEELGFSTRAYYHGCRGLVERSLEAMTPVLEAVEKRALAGIYVVGGGASLPAVPRRLREDLGRKVHRSPLPSAAVAVGLAIAADETSGFEVTSRLSRYFGVFREREAGRDVAFDPIFGRDQALPGRGPRPVVQREYRALHNLGRYRYVETSALDPLGLPHERLKAVGEVTFPFEPSLRAPGIDLREVPVERRDGGPWIREEYAIDPMGLVEIALTDLETGYVQRHTMGA